MGGIYAVENALRERLRWMTAGQAKEVVDAISHADYIILERRELEYLQQRASDLDALERGGEG